MKIFGTYHKGDRAELRNTSILSKMGDLILAIMKKGHFEYEDCYQWITRDHYNKYHVCYPKREKVQQSLNASF